MANEVRIIELELPVHVTCLRLPAAVDRRLGSLLDKQDRGETLTDQESAEAEGLVELSDLLSAIQLRARVAPQP
jgi:hypothetical protein